jgi:serine/threonine protein kinase
MSPEAWEGKPLDAQADIWSLRVVLFEMLTGQVPFGGDTGAAVMNKVLTTQPPDLKRLRSDVPAGLARIVSRMLVRDKNRRYPTMRQLAADLERGQQAMTALAKKPKVNIYRLALLVIAIPIIILLIFMASGRGGLSIFTPAVTTTLYRTTTPDYTLTPMWRFYDDSTMGFAIEYPPDWWISSR